ncbi:MAG: cytochrome c [Deltaproteobacteria bacterium]|nr:cytochrome c [Deltaproteobacteria bacterium]
MHRLLLLFILCLSLFMGSGCGSARRGVPISGPMDTSEARISRGEKIFKTHCSQCHPGGEAGVGPALNNKWLPGFLLKMQVRKGYGAMPSFPAGHLSDSELDDLVSYMKALRRHG